MTFQEKCDTIIENLNSDSVIKLLMQLGAEEYNDKADYIVFRTICHHENAEDGNMKLYYYKDNHFFMCYSCCGGMNIFSFLKNYYEIRGIKYDWYQDIYLVAESCSINLELIGDTASRWEKKADRYKRREIFELPSYNEGVLDLFTKYYPIEWLNDGITTETMDKFEISFSIPQNKIIIPHRDVHGRLIGIRGRALNKEEIEYGAKYAPICIENNWYKHKLSLNLYGLYQNKENIKEQGICYVFESEKAVL